MFDTTQFQHFLADTDPIVLAALIAAVAFVESFAILGIIVPGVAILASCAFVAGTGALAIWSCLASAFFGAVLGDGLSFLIGYRLKSGVRFVWPFSVYPDWIERGELFFDRYGPFSVVVGRFIGPIRPVIPLVAGAMGMSAWLFLSVNFASALVWAPVYIVPGYLLGAAIQTRFDTPEILAAAIIILLCAIGLFVWLRRHFKS